VPASIHSSGAIGGPHPRQDPSIGMVRGSPWFIPVAAHVTEIGGPSLRTDGGRGELGDAEEGEADQAGEPAPSSADEACAGAGRVAVSKVRGRSKISRSTTGSGGASRVTMLSRIS
jgi:hypothetical protein